MIFRFVFLFFFLPASAAFAQSSPYLVVLGIAQDGGYPHMGCRKKCCALAWAQAGQARKVTSLAVADPAAGKWWLFEASPDIRGQLQEFGRITKGQFPYLPEGIWLSHAHIGHYTGLMQLGREVMNAREVNVYVLPRFRQFIERNGPWSQLVSLKNIRLQELKADSAVHAGQLAVTAFTVPHRDEFSETAGFRIVGPGRKYLFIPDIDKWSKWNRNIIDEVKAVDVALLDATFYSADELPGRAMSEVPHPLVTETMSLFEKEPASVKQKIRFTHLNHTNPLLWDTAARKRFLQTGYRLASEGEIIP